MAVELPTYIPVAEATEKYRVGRRELDRLVESGRVRAVQVNGGIAVAEEDVKETTIRPSDLWDRVKGLDGEPIGLGEARRKYRLGAASLNRWVELGYVRVLDDQRGGGRGRKRMLNEADVAYIALVADERGRRPGRRILTPEFSPPHVSSL
jgi:hypothetical protein